MQEQRVSTQTKSSGNCTTLNVILNVQYNFTAIGLRCKSVISYHPIPTASCLCTRSLFTIPCTPYTVIMYVCLSPSWPKARSKDFPCVYYNMSQFSNLIG